MTGHIITDQASCGLHFLLQSQSCPDVDRRVNNASSEQIYFLKLCKAPWFAAFTLDNVLALYTSS